MAIKIYVVYAWSLPQQKFESLLTKLFTFSTSGVCLNVSLNDNIVY